jgi:hypothetical protein
MRWKRRAEEVESPKARGDRTTAAPRASVDATVARTSRSGTAPQPVTRNRASTVHRSQRCGYALSCIGEHANTAAGTVPEPQRPLGRRPAEALNSACASKNRAENGA